MSCLVRELVARLRDNDSSQTSFETITKQLNDIQHDVKRNFSDRSETPNPTNYRDALVNSTKVNASNQNDREFEIKFSGIPELPTGKSAKPRKNDYQLTEILNHFGCDNAKLKRFFDLELLTVLVKLKYELVAQKLLACASKLKDFPKETAAHGILIERSDLFCFGPQLSWPYIFYAPRAHVPCFT